MTSPKPSPKISEDDFPKYAGEFSNDPDFPQTYDEWNDKQQVQNSKLEVIEIPVPFNDYLEYCIKSGLESNIVTLGAFAVYLLHKNPTS